MKTVNRYSLIGIFNFVLTMLILSLAGVQPLLAVPIATTVAVGSWFAPETFGLRSGFITAGSEYNGQENVDLVLRPVFTGPDIKSLGLRVVFTKGSGSVKMTFFDALTKIVRKYSDGFQGAAGSATRRQKKFTLDEFKAEAEYSKQDYKNEILEIITNRGGINQNDITGTQVHEAEKAMFFAGVMADNLRYLWLGDKAKKFVQNGLRYDNSGDVVVDGTGTYVSGGDDIFYYATDGLWKQIMANAATSPTANQIKRIAVSNGTVAQVTTVTLTGTSGTANIKINNVNYLVTFNTSLTQTATDFDTTHSAALTALDITVTTSTVDVILTSAIAGQPFSTVTITNVSGDLAGSVVATTANTAAAALAADEAIGYMKQMVNNAPAVLKRFINGASTTFEGANKTGVINVPTSLQLRFYCTDTWIENYRDTLINDGTELAHMKTVDGIERLTYLGIPLIPMGIDQYLSTDFISPYPHRCLLTSPENMVLVLNGSSELAETRFWFNPDQNTNRQRTQYEFGVDYGLPELMVAAY